MDAGKFRPTERQHFGGGIQFHGARPERYHRLRQRNVFALQLLDVAHQIGFGVVLLEYFVMQSRRVAQQFLRHGNGGDGSKLCRHLFAKHVCKDGYNFGNAGCGGRLVGADAYDAVG